MVFSKQINTETFLFFQISNLPCPHRNEVHANTFTKIKKQTNKTWNNLFVYLCFGEKCFAVFVNIFKVFLFVFHFFDKLLKQGKDQIIIRPTAKC